SMRQMLEGSITTFTLDRRYMRPDGSPVWAQLTIALLRAPTGEPECFISVVEDISGRKAAEAALVASEAQLQQSVARLQAVLEVLPVGVALTDAQGSIQQLNRTFKQVWGEEAPLVESVAGYRAYRGWWPDGRPLASEEWGAALAVQRGELVLGQEIEIETFTGERK